MSTIPPFQLVDPIQGQCVWPWKAEPFDHELGQLHIRYLEVVEESLQMFVVRFLLGGARKCCGQDRKVDGPHSRELYEKALHEFDMSMVSR
jgi:hypothetical protein